MTAALTGAAIERAHRRSVQVSVAEAARSLQDLLTRRLTAYIVNVKDGKSITRWINGEVKVIRPESEVRLRTAYEIQALLSRYESPQTIRAWFIGLNPDLGDVSPAEAIHEGRLQEALAAAREFVARD
jgi:hypothetical protein